jgi:hypothetical protein
MDILLAAMAFAVLMIVFSTVVTGITETFLRVSGYRAQVLAASVLRFLKNDPNVANFVKKKGLAGNPDIPEDDLEKVARQLTFNHALTDASTIDKIGGLIARYTGRYKVDTLTTYSFLQRLATTDLGRAIAKRGEEHVLRGLTIGFERYVAASNEVFRKNAQATTMVLSIVFAFLFNIDAVRLFEHLLQNNETTEALIAQANDRIDDNKAALAKFQATLADDTSTEQGDAIEDIQAASNEAVEAMTALRTETGLPIGFDYYPYGSTDCKPERGCDIVSGWFLLWAFQVLLAGFLIGLGGPFWYRVFASLSHVVQVLRSIRGEARSEIIKEDAPTSQPASQSLIKALRAADTPPDSLIKEFRILAGFAPDLSELPDTTVV